MLSNLNFRYQYRSSNDDIHNDFYLPCLQNSKQYDRASGYFTSESFKLLAKGLEIFLEKGGNIRIVANPNLTTEDIEAIEKGHAAKDELIEKNFLNEIKIGYRTIEDDTLNVISWLIYRGQLEFKIAFTKNNAIYHEKFGIFTDEKGHSISFSGSANETFSGLSRNFEKIDVYSDKKDSHRIQNSINDFNDLWNNRTNELEVIELPDSIKRELISHRTDLKKYNLKVSPSLTNNERFIEERDYQKEAINKWVNSDFQGILEMATGTGKTITSLLSVNRYIKMNNRCLTVIIVPFTHLVEQWEKDINIILKQNILKCIESKTKWVSKAKSLVQEYNLGLIEKQVIITTYKTSKTKEFKKIFSNVVGPTLLISDECHYITQNGFNDFPFKNFKAKLGLSATPDRWWDEEGTLFLKNSIGEVVYTYSLDQAINNKKLTPYEYYPHVVTFSDEEMLRYNNITKKIIKISNKNSEEENDYLKKLYIQRSNLIYKAKNKIEQFIEDIQKEDLSNIKHTLVYCAPGDIDEIVKEIYKLNLKVSKFNHDIKNKEREVLLKMFEEGKIQILVAIKCLDEGVDIPATVNAYFLSSTSNPREFVQRRGRILRKFEGKKFAKLHDYIVLPVGLPFEDFNKIAVKELPRFTEFSNSALNYSETKINMSKLLNEYNLTHLMYKDPWEVYKEMKEMYNDDSFK